MLVLTIPGAFVVPTPASGLVAVTAGTGAWPGTRTELIAANQVLTQNDFFLLGYIFNGPGTYSAFRLYSGASNGVLIHEEPVSDSKDHFPLPILLPGGTRVSTDVLVSSGSLACTMGLICAGRSQVTDDSAIVTGILVGNIAPAPNTVTDLATVPAGRFVPDAVVMVRNQGATDQAVKVAVSPLGVTYDAAAHDIITWATIKAGTTLPVPVPFVLQGTDKIRVWTNGNVPVTSVFGDKTITTNTSITFTISAVTRS